MPRRFAKQPTEVKDYDFDFSPIIPAGDSLPADVNKSTLTKDPSSNLTFGTKTHDTATGRVKQWLSAGAAGTKYKVTCLLETTQGRKFELEMVLSVLDH